MKLYSRPLVRTLRRAALRQIRQSPALRREHRLRRRWFSSSYGKTGFFLALLIYGILALINGVSPQKPDFPFVLIALYCTGTVVLRSRALFSRLHGPGELNIFEGVPLPDTDFFRLQWTKFLLRTGVVLGFAFLSYGLLAFQYSRLGFQEVCVVVPAAVAQWLVVVSISVFALDLRSPWLPRIASALYLAAFALIYAPASFSTTVAALTVVLPAGWVNRAYKGLLAGHVSSLIWLLPVSALVLAGLARVRRARDSYRPLLFQDHESAAPSQVPDLRGADALAPGQEELEAASTPVSFALASRRIAAGELSRMLDWNASGWIERLAGFLLTRDDRPVADFMVGHHLGQWSSGWTKGFYISAAAIIAAGLVPGTPLWLATIAAFLAAMYAAPVLGGNWLGFSSVAISMKESLLAAFYPVSYWQASRVIFKVNAVRLLAYSILLFPTVIVLSWKAGMSVDTGVSLAVRIMFWLVIWQFAAVLAQHSKGTNDSRTYSWGTVLFLVFGLFFILFLIVGVFVSFVPEAPYGAWVGALIVTPMFVLAWWLYGLLYSRGRIDLMREPGR